MVEKGKYGYFDQEKREYVVTEPKTPTPWINYLGDGEYGGIVSNTGGGYSFDCDPRYKRVLRYRYNSIPEDQPGRYIYIRDDETGEVWSATWQPVKAEYDQYKCRHGLGYTVISQQHSGINSEVTYFVPTGKKMEFWWLKLKNNSTRPRKLSIFSYAEFCFFDAVKDQQNVDWVQQIQQGDYEDGFIFWNAFMKTWEYIFFTANQPAHSFDTSRERFIGRYRDLSLPLAVENGECGNSLARRGNGVGALCHKFVLPPNGEEEVVYALGVTAEKEQCKAEVKPICRPEVVRDLFMDLHNYWERFLASLQVETAEPAVNLLLNTWNPYQCKTTFNWSRFVSLYQLGISRGMGLRDSAQDVLGVVHAVPDQARELLVKLLKCQFADGHAYHLFYPLTGEGGLGEAEGGKYNWYSDDHLWLIEATVAYLKETGDFAFLDSKVPFTEEGEAGTVWEHLQKAVEFTAKHLGEHGLPLSGFADWNDTLNLDKGVGRAESVWTGMLYCRALNLMIELSNFLGKEAESVKYSKLYAEMKTAINTHAWDGQWYLRAFDDWGEKVGSKTQSEGQIYLNAQTWAVISGIAEEERAQTAIDKANELLGTEYGFVLVYPAYKAHDPRRGGITTYPPGAKENGGIFVHTNPWLIMAELLLGRKNEAYEHYLRIVPIFKNDLADLHEVEPYVYCQNILGKEHPQFGLGRNSWLTGTASWAYVVATQYLLGIRPDYDGLILDPRVPDHWDRFKVHRVFRGKELEITYNRAGDGERGIYVNGEFIGDLRKIPLSRLEKSDRLSVEVRF
ncbi:MAG TPA: glycosyl transferase [Firmicutes bacterium]|nr:glycosyl transferase [Bacillota bacterium]